MAKKKKSNLPAVRTTYNTFWDSFILRSTGLIVLPKHNPFICTEDDKGIIKVALSEPIHFVGLPYKSTSSKSEKAIDVLINSSEEIHGDTLQVERSRVHVSYFEVRNRGGASGKSETAVPIESIHYDFDIKQDKAHPLFHAQFCLNIIEKEIRDKSTSFKKYNVNPESLNDSRIQHLKIPTAHMSLFSVLISICADHTASKLPDLLGVLIGAYLEITSMPKADIKSIHGRIQKHNSFKSMHWYLEGASA